MSSNHSARCVLLAGCILVITDLQTLSVIDDRSIADLIGTSLTPITSAMLCYVMLCGI